MTRPWRSWINAEIYDQFVHERSIYGWLNRALVRRAEVGRCSRLLDLACGTGATTLACLREMGPRATIVGIDSSPEMIEVARANVLDPRAEFEVAPAAEVHRLQGSFDCVVCNAAFWQFESPRAVFSAIARITRPRTRFVFNAPIERVVGESAPVHPFQIALAQEIDRELGEPLPALPTTLEPSAVAEVARSHGFTRTGMERRRYEGRQDELIELMTIPAMIEPLTPGLSDDRRRQVLERARRRCDPQMTVAVPWIYFVFERDHPG